MNNMKKLAIISEFNPFHNGHKYLLEKSKEITQADLAISFMSGDFVQRGEPSLIDKYSRAEVSSKEGFDLVIEMPNFISLQSASFFAYKSIEILDKLDLDYLCFGIENISCDEFNKIIEILFDKENILDNLTAKYLREGNSYTRSSYLAMEEILEDTSFISANNILALEYVSAIKKLSSKIKPVPIERLGAKNKDKTIKNKNFASSTAIRKNINSDVSSLLPRSSYLEIENFKKTYKTFPSWDILYEILKYKIIIEKEKVDDILCYEEGLENLFYKNILKAENFQSFLDLSLSSRYTKSRIKRFALNYILENKKDLNDVDINFIKVLTFNKKATNFFRDSKMNIVMNKKDAGKLDSYNKKILDNMVKASNLYSLLIDREFYTDFTRKFILK